MLSLKEYFLVGKLGGVFGWKIYLRIKHMRRIGIQKTKQENKNIFPGNNGYLKFIDGKWFKKKHKITGKPIVQLSPPSLN